MKFTKIGAQPPSSGGTPPGKTIFQLEPHMKVRFNSDGWVEELGRGTEATRRARFCRDYPAANSTISSPAVFTTCIPA